MSVHYLVYNDPCNFRLLTDDFAKVLKNLGVFVEWKKTTEELHEVYKSVLIYKITSDVDYDGFNNKKIKMRFSCFCKEVDLQMKIYQQRFFNLMKIELDNKIKKLNETVRYISVEVSNAVSKTTNEAKLYNRHSDCNSEDNNVEDSEEEEEDINEDYKISNISNARVYLYQETEAEKELAELAKKITNEKSLV
jgi:hypothetical protein